jgi:hypothetical protein
LVVDIELSITEWASHSLSWEITPFMN